MLDHIVQNARIIKNQYRLKHKTVDLKAMRVRPNIMSHHEKSVVRFGFLNNSWNEMEQFKEFMKWSDTEEGEGVNV